MNKSDVMVIGICGAKGAGKSTIANMIEELIPTHQVALAGPLKQVAGKVLEMDPRDFEELHLKERPFTHGSRGLTEANIHQIYNYFCVPTPAHWRNHLGGSFNTPRAVLQYIGTEMLRSESPDIHCKLAEETFSPLRLNIITDVRFMNEFTYFRDNYRNFKLIYVKNPYAEKAAEADLHPSERGVTGLAAVASVTITNVGTLDELGFSVADAMFHPDLSLMK